MGERRCCCCDASNPKQMLLLLLLLLLRCACEDLQDTSTVRGDAPEVSAAARRIASFSKTEEAIAIDVAHAKRGSILTGGQEGLQAAALQLQGGGGCGSGVLLLTQQLPLDLLSSLIKLLRLTARTQIRLQIESNPTFRTPC